MKKLFGLLLVLLAAGCSTAVVRPYVGEQPAWPTSPGSILITRYELPVFTTLPPAPYRVLAELLLESPFYATPEPGQMPVLIKRAKQMGADAIVLVRSSSFFVQGPTIKPTGAAATPGGVTAINAFNPESFRGGVSVVAVQWLGSAPEGMPAKFQKATPPKPPTGSTEPSTDSEPASTSKVPNVPKTDLGPATDTKPLEVPPTTIEPPSTTKAVDVPTTTPAVPEPNQKTLETLMDSTLKTTPTNSTPAAPKVEDPRQAPVPTQ